MYNQPFYIPGYSYGSIPGIANSQILRAAAPVTSRAIPSSLGLGASQVARTPGLFGRLSQTVGAIKSLNWGGLINNTSKTLGIINQTIPLVRQVGPMVGNMRSMLKIASVFKDETDVKQPTTNKKETTYNQRKTPTTKTNYQQNNSSYKEKKEDSNNHKFIEESPTFFID